MNPLTTSLESIELESESFDLPGAPAHGPGQGSTGPSSHGVLETLLHGLQGLSLTAAVAQGQPPYIEGPQLEGYGPVQLGGYGPPQLEGYRHLQQHYQQQQAGLQGRPQVYQQQHTGVQQHLQQPGLQPLIPQPALALPQQHQQHLGLRQLLPQGAIPTAAAYGLQPGPLYEQPLGSSALRMHLGQARPAGNTSTLAGQAARAEQQPRGRKAQHQQDLAKIRRTVYVCDIDQAVSEAELAGFFQECGPIVDCRVCGDPSSTMRFAFIEFQLEASARQALAKSGSMLGLYKLRVAPSKTAIVPVKKDFLPMSTSELELVARTIYVANIDKSVEREALYTFFSNLCGSVTKMRLLGDAHHASKIAFIEFENAASAKQALNCSGAVLGTLPLRISPSKTPVRLDANKATAMGYSYGFPPPHTY